MKFILYVPGMVFDADLFGQPGFSLGGSETMGYYVAHELAKRGHSVYVFCNTPNEQQKNIAGVNYLPIGQTNQQFPFGVNFERFATNIPCDVLLAQRNPAVFAKQYNSKMNYWWTHDLALHKIQPHINAMIWNVDRVFAVSQYHADQVAETYGIKDDFLGVLRNAVDLGLYHQMEDVYDDETAQAKINSKLMVYSHRPERGLINLVQPGGIMEQLAKIDPEITLGYCSYDNVTQETQGLYAQLDQWASMLPNVRNLGSLDKRTLARTQKAAWLHVYPTQFKETSCITMMEEQAAGTPVLATREGALPETLRNAGVYWSDLDSFVKNIVYLKDNPDKWKSLRKRALNKAKEYSVERTVTDFLETVESDFMVANLSKSRVFDHLIETSDIRAASIYGEQYGLDTQCLLDRFPTLGCSFQETVEFYEKNAQRDKKIGVTHNLDNLDGLLGMGRLQPVMQHLSRLKPDAKVMDYGCAVGHVSLALKKVFPKMTFVGVDISQDAIDTGSKFIKDNNVEDVELVRCTDPFEFSEEHKEEFDACICLEVLEHVTDYDLLVSALSQCVKDGGRLIFSTPYGPHEMNDDETTIKQHLHNFEEMDIRDIAEDQDELDITYIASRPSKNGSHLGNYVWGWGVDHSKSYCGRIDYSRKLSQLKPRQRISICMIVQPDGNTLRKTLESVKHIASEIIVGVDDPKWFNSGEKEAHDAYTRKVEGGVGFFETEMMPLAYRILDEFDAEYFPIESPLKQGFDSARNETIKAASNEWIMWLDDDETLIFPERVLPFARNNQFDSYGVPQQHISAQPVGVLKTDYPSRIFRNNKGIRFFGVVHEHPETALNKGAGQTYLLNENHFMLMHVGYDTEDTRRKRFQRNFPLMERDHAMYPERKLGMFLWVRDLAHWNRFEMEQGGVTAKVVERAKEILVYWRSIVKEGNTRVLNDFMQYVTESVNIVTNGGGLAFRFALDINKEGMGDDVNSPMNATLAGKVETVDDLKMLQDMVMKEKIEVSKIQQPI